MEEWLREAPPNPEDRPTEEPKLDREVPEEKLPRETPLLGRLAEEPKLLRGALLVVRPAPEE